MQSFNFNNKTFSLLENSEKGTVNSATLFHYKQEGDLVTADYSGGSVVYGKIIAIHKGDTLDMLYQCLTTENELKAGKALAKVITTTTGKIKLKLNWEWLDKKGETGTSEYLEN